MNSSKKYKTRKIINSQKDTSEEELLLKIQTDVKLNNYLKTGSIQKKIIDFPDLIILSPIKIGSFPPPAIMPIFDIKLCKCILLYVNL